MNVLQLQETLIVWTDPETDTELALSFQEVAGCKEIWDQINTIQKLATAADSDEDGVSLNSTMYIEGLKILISKLTANR
jgi:protein phosphatase-4 regulatory subunit 3